MWFEEFRDGRHGGYTEYQNGTILAFLNLNNTSMPPIKFQLNPTPFGSICGFKIFKMAVVAWRPSWISERNDFSNSEFSSSSNAAHQVSDQSDTILEEMSKMWKINEWRTDEEHVWY